MDGNATYRPLAWRSDNEGILGRAVAGLASSRREREEFILG